MFAYRNNKMKNAIIKTIALIMLPFFFAACNKVSETALERARTESDPVKALEIIRQAEDSYLENCSRPRDCDVPAEFVLAEQGYFIKAAKAGNERALRELFASNAGFEKEKKELQTTVIERAGTSQNMDLQIAAAAIYGNDKFGIVNKSQEIRFLKRAWVAGDAKSAGELALIYVRLKDFDRAYFWSLRCVQECDRSSGTKLGEYATQIELGELEKQLDVSKITSIQNKAADKSLID